MLYFAYGSNLLHSEVERTVENVRDRGRAFLPGYRIEFSKHSKKWQADAATIVPNPSRIVWGFVYEVDERGLEDLREREGGYDLKDDLLVYLNPPGTADPPARIKTFTFTARQTCQNSCGPSPEYLEIVIKGAKERGLPAEYVAELELFGTD